MAIQNIEAAAGTVLLVEDDVVLSKLMATLLDAAGYHPVTIADHEQIDEAMDRFDPKCVILDGEVGRTGRSRSWEDAARIRRDHPEVPVLMFTADADALAEDGPWRRLLLEATARQATLALHQSRLAEQSRIEARHQAVLEERNRLARDIHDTLAQGFAGILMQLQSVQRCTSSLPPNIARSIDNAVDLARSHMIEARRSVGALRPQDIEAGDVAAVLERTTELARRTTDVPIELVVEEIPALGAGVEREIVGIAQEALTNAVRHARARRITVRASTIRSLGLRLSIADDGRGIARDMATSGFGMTSMQERAERIGASLTIVTAPRSGTEVVLAWEPSSLPTQIHVVS